MFFLLILQLFLTPNLRGETSANTTNTEESVPAHFAPTAFAQSNSTVFSEDFEGTFPEPNWNYPYDGNAYSGYDYWGGTPMRSHGGSYSAWCAQVGSQEVNHTIWTEGFEGAFPGSNWLVGDYDSRDGEDYWGDTSYRSYSGNWSGWCAQVGQQASEGQPNRDVHVYDNYMYARMRRSVNLSVYSSVWLSYKYWLVCEEQLDLLRIAYWNQIEPGDIEIVRYSGNSDGWQSGIVSIPTDAVAVGFIFISDVSVAYEGAYIDDVALIGTSEDPNTSVGHYDDNMEASMYRNVTLTAYSSVTLSYWYWIDSEYGYDYLQVIYSNITGWFYVDLHQGSSGGWQYSEVVIPVTANYVGFYFCSDSSVHNYEGAYVDDVLLIGLIPPGILEGTITELGTGTPIANAIVNADGQTTPTDGFGHYEFELEAGIYKIIVRRDHYYSTFVEGVSVVPGMATIRDIALPPGYPSVTNGGFESGDLTEWVSVDVEGLPLGPSSNVTVTNVGARSGAYSLKLEGKAQVLQVFGGAAILKGNLSFWAKCMDEGVTSSMSLAVMTDPSISPITYTFPLGDTWTKIVIPVPETSHWILVAFATYLPDLPSSGVAPEAKLIDDVWIGYEPLIESCDQAGTRKDFFNETETVYVYGSGYLPTFLCNVYVVEDATWTDGKLIAPGSVTLTTTWSNGTGHVNAAPAYPPPLAIGKYDVVIDVNDNGKYDIGIDALDDNDVEVTAGLVIPEFPSFLILLLFMIFSLANIFSLNKRVNRN